MKLSTELTKVARNLVAGIIMPDTEVLRRAERILTDPELWEVDFQNRMEMIQWQFEGLGIHVSFLPGVPGSLNSKTLLITAGLDLDALKSPRDMRHHLEPFLDTLTHELIHRDQALKAEGHPYTQYHYRDKDVKRIKERSKDLSKFGDRYRKTVNLDTKKLHEIDSIAYWGNPSEQMAYAGAIVTRLRKDGNSDSDILRMIQKGDFRHTYTVVTETDAGLVQLWQVLRSQPSDKARKRFLGYMVKYLKG